MMQMPNRLRRPRGAFNILTFLLLIALVVSIWGAWLYVPLMLDHIDCKEVVSQAASSVFLDGPEIAKARAMARLNGSIGWHDALDPTTGQTKRAPGLGIDPDQLTIESDRDSNQVQVRLTYRRTIQLRPFQEWRSFDFAAERALSRP